MLNKFIKLIAIPFFLALCIFNLVPMDISIYTATIFLILSFLILSVNYSIGKNLNYVLHMIISCLSFAAGYICNIDITKESYISYPFLGALISALILLYILNKIENELLTNTKTSERLYPERKADIERLRFLLENNNIIGINGPWGSGKSFITDHLSDKYILVKIDLLSSNIDDIQQVILHELDKTLRAEGIFSIYSPQLKRFFGQNTWIDRIVNIFINKTSSYSNVINGFRFDLGKLSKDIIIVFEDIDRIDNKESIKKILCIADKLSSDRIKVIYQYHMENLINTGFSESYLEKFIHTSMNITEIPFKTILEEIVSKSSLLNMNDFSKLTMTLENMPISYSEKNYSFKDNFSISITCVTIRRMKNFIKEIEHILRNYEYIGDKEHIIYYFFLKYFMYEKYKKINVYTSLLDTFPIKYNDKLYTIKEILESDDTNNATLSEIFSYNENVISIFILSLFDYNYENITVSKDMDWEAIQNTLTQQYRNEKIDRLIWKLTANGKSEYTDVERAFNSLFEMVLKKNKTEWDANYIAFNNKWHSGSIFDKDTRDNTTVELLGISFLLTLSKNFFLIEYSTKNRLLFLDFFFHRKENNHISLSLIESLLYFDLTDKKIFMRILKGFNKLPFNGNMNNLKEYKVFIKKYIIALVFYSDTYIVPFDVIDQIIVPDKDLDPSIYKKLKISSFTDNLKEINRTVLVESIQGDIDLMLKFIEKNWEIISCKETYREPDNIFDRRTPHPTNNEVLDRLNAIKDKEKFLKELDKEYQDGTIKLGKILNLKPYKALEDSFNKNSDK